MRDVIWTIIILWLVWRIYEAFKSVSTTKTKGANFYQSKNTTRKEGEVRIDNETPKQKTYIKPDQGEYVDFEEIN